MTQVVVVVVFYFLFGADFKKQDVKEWLKSL